MVATPWLPKENLYVILKAFNLTNEILKLLGIAPQTPLKIMAM